MSLSEHMGQNNSLKFLVDIGTAISVIPFAPEDNHTQLPSNYRQQMAFCIETFGMKQLTLNISMCYDFTWSFI